MAIKIVLAKAHENQQNDPEIQRELSDIQTFFTEKEFNFEVKSLNFVILRGLYSHVDRMLTVIGVFVNKTEKTINGLKAELAFRVKGNPEARLSGVKLDLPQYFLGDLKPNEGFVLHIKVMTKGLSKEKETYQATELLGELRNIEITH
ncbi:hypothetical protein JSQ81_05215 [Sporosarcina sp. Marseille-Q4063]|uniref:hypothetical protein n=1 Tax=Sporosarcina sp. Marseille-Q4063 TaxID=2810514 RepID=UPI001BB0B690|nr:hypothetical protein [Sporosarcina sp. Marseille-Q4063]QUW22976.1 hypothetical protein JSQ81_05215 [Sporosarcina sp. Marseille-Q4063]